MIVFNLEVMMAKRKISSGELADRVGITRSVIVNALRKY